MVNLFRAKVARADEGDESDLVDIWSWPRAERLALWEWRDAGNECSEVVRHAQVVTAADRARAAA